MARYGGGDSKLHQWMLTYGYENIFLRVMIAWTQRLNLNAIADMVFV
jgi:hypothetical protein